jgi:hypothetical protein
MALEDSVSIYRSDYRLYDAESYVSLICHHILTHTNRSVLENGLNGCIIFLGVN